MSPRESFGQDLRRIRLQRGVSLEAIARATKVCVSLWEGLERNDLSRWPTGIYARAYLREYASAIGEDAESVVDEFCRCFPQVERRIAAPIHEHSRILWHVTHWRNDLARLIEGDGQGSHSTPRSA